MRNLLIVLLGLLALLVWARPAHAAESYANCNNVITALPATITTPGVWCLKQSLTSAATTGYGINVQSSNVTLDCNDFILSNTGGTSGKAIGIYTTNNVDITVRHCNIQGFLYGMVLASPSTASFSGGGLLVEDNIFYGNTAIGALVEGNGSVIRHNQVLSTGGSLSAVSVYGIRTLGTVSILDNTVSGVTAAAGGGSAYGIYTSGAGSVDDNRIRELTPNGKGTIYGIYSNGSNQISMQRNNVFGGATTAGTGMSCADASARARENVISGFTTGLQNCADAGNNDVSP